MKILRIISFGFPGGGAETGVIEVDEILKKHGHTIKIISSDAHPEKEHFSDYEFSAIDAKDPFKIFLHILNPSAYKIIRKVLKEYKPDIVHLHTMGEVSPLALLLFKDIPTLMTIHGPEFFIPKLIPWTLNKDNFKNGRIDGRNLNLTGKINYSFFKYIQGSVYKQTLKNVNLFIFLSAYMQKLTGGKLAPNKIIPNGIKLLEFKEARNNHKLLYVGRLHKYKGVEYAIKALPAIVKKYPDTVLSILGEGPFKSNLVSLVSHLDLQQNVNFVGWVEHGKIEKYYEETSIFLMPSYWPEAFGKSGVEAMSKGRPVIASRVGGIPEWLTEGEVGFLVDPKSPDQISKNVIKLFDDEMLLKSMGKNARKRAEMFSIEKFADNLENVYFDFKNKSGRKI